MSDSATDSLPPDPLAALELRATRVAGRALELASWGGALACTAIAYRPESQRTLARVLEQAATRQEAVLARGAGLSMGDGAISGRGSLVLTARLDRVLAFDEELGTITAEAGVPLAVLDGIAAARGFMLPVTGLPGTATLGGVIAADTAGLNHEPVGTFGSNTLGLLVMLADGSVQPCSPEEQPMLFHSTVGGFGLTGVILAAEIQLQPRSAGFTAERQLLGDADDVLGGLQDAALAGASAAAWLDVSGRGTALRRALLCIAHPGAGAGEPAEHAGLMEPPRRWKTGGGPLSTEAVLFPTLPPLRGRGLLRVEALLPDSIARQMLVHVVEEAGNPRPLLSARLDRMGGHSAALLAFPAPGYRLQLDFADSDAGRELAGRLAQVALEFGGRIALSSDSRMASGGFRHCYPQYRQFMQARSLLDPDRRFQSDLAHRLSLLSE